MLDHHPYSSNLSLESQNTNSFNTYLKQSSDIIIPLSSLEPYGELGNFEVNSICAAALSQAVSSELKIMAAPVLKYGCSSRYKAFPGSIGLKPKIFCSMLQSICSDCFFQGFKRVIILNVSEENVSALDLLGKRFNNQKDSRIDFFSVQSDRQILEFADAYLKGTLYGRHEFMMLSMASYLKSDSVSKRDSDIVLPSADVYTAWKRRGKDPEKFRKLFPQAVSSDIAGCFSSEFGEKMFDFIVKLLCNRYSPLQSTKDNNATSQNN